MIACSLLSIIDVACSKPAAGAAAAELALMVERGERGERDERAGIFVRDLFRRHAA